MELNNDHSSLIYIIDDMNSKGKVPAAAQTNVSRYKKLRASKNETIAKVKQTVEMLNSDASMIDLNALGDLLGKIKQLTEKEVGLEADIRKLLAGAESEKKKLVEPEQEPEAEPEMIRAEPASATVRTSEIIRAEPASATGRTSEMIRAEPASATGRTSEMIRAGPASATGRTSEIIRAEPASATGRTSEMIRAEPASAMGRTSEIIRAEPASAAGRTSESLSVQKSSGSKKRKKPAQEVNSQGETLWCHCRRPEFGKMVACDGKHCRHEWFHVGCVGYKDGDEQNTKKWLCKDCKQLLKLAQKLYPLM